MLGQGAMGAVYLVRDRETGEQLARKKLFRMDGKSALRIKREFRSLADLSHPNLVKVYELGRSNDGWFLTMEYLEGEDLHTHLGLDSARSAGSGIAAAFSQLRSRDRWLDEVALPAFHQLAQGVLALHRAGMLHRDLKPSNVLVASGRVVVLDFGLVRELDPSAPSLTEDGGIAGTPAYMAPEQALGKGLSEATDWYAFGAMLYEMLTGELPFDGAVYELLRNKLERDPRPPVELDASIPAHLSALCMELLARDPSARPKGSDVLARLLPPNEQASLTRPARGDTTLQTDTESQDPERGFFGRKPELAALWDALREADRGRTIVAHVRGISGAGKSALVEQFLDEVEHEIVPVGRPEALVLRSRSSTGKICASAAMSVGSRLLTSKSFACAR
jgi:eukaryotic-like serine/threonine-protein kinase